MTPHLLPNRKVASRPNFGGHQAHHWLNWQQLHLNQPIAPSFASTSFLASITLLFFSFLLRRLDLTVIDSVSLLLCSACRGREGPVQTWSLHLLHLLWQIFVRLYFPLSCESLAARPSCELRYAILPFPSYTWLLSYRSVPGSAARR